MIAGSNVTRCRHGPVPLLVAMLAVPAPAAADLCVWVDSETAARAAAVIANAAERLDLERARAAPLGRVEVTREGGNSSRVLLDGEAVDLAHLFVRGADGGWQNVGWLLLGCGDDDEPKRLVDEPFVRISGAASAPPPPASMAWFALAELPTILKQWSDDDPEPRPVEAFDSPEPRAVRVATLVDTESLPTREWDYERAGAFVVEERGDWVRIRLHRGTGWIRRQEAGAIHPFVELVKNGLSYLDETWDGRLFGAPGGGEARRLDTGWRARLFGDTEVAAEVLETATVLDRLWLKVRVTTPPCAAEDPTVLAEGWIPYAGPNGEPTVGFYSRGC